MWTLIFLIALLQLQMVVIFHFQMKLFKLEGNTTFQLQSLIEMFGFVQYWTQIEWYLIFQAFIPQLKTNQMASSESQKQ